MPLRREHSDFRPLAFQKRIGGYRGAMDDALRLPQQIGQLHAQCFRENGEPRDNAFGLIRRCAGSLGERCGAIRRHADHIGKSAPDINADAIGHDLISPRLLVSSQAFSMGAVLRGDDKPRTEVKSAAHTIEPHDKCKNEKP